MQEKTLPVLLNISSLRSVDITAVISVEEIGRLLQIFYRKTLSGLPFPKAFYPSGGTLYPVQVYLRLSELVGSDLSGYYYYNPLEHQLVRLGDLTQNDCSSLMPVQLFLVADFAVVEPLYGDLSNTLCQAEAGYMAQLIESSLASSITLTRVKNNNFSNIHDVLKLNKSHCLLQVYEGGICTDSVVQLPDLMLTHANRKSYRAYENLLVLDDLYKCLSALQHRASIEPLYCSYYVYLRHDCTSLAGKVLKAGAYSYDAKNNLLVLVGIGSNDLISLGENALIEAGSGFVILMVNHCEANITNALFESGFNGQLLSNIGLTLGVGFCAIGNLNQHVARKLLQLSEEDVVVHALIGGKINSQQMETVCTEKSPINIEKLLGDYVKEALPEYMVPGFYVLLDEIPLTSNGKVDRKALPEPDISALEAMYVEPRTEIEQILCNVWRKLLNVETVGVYDHFFKLGGNSLLAIRLASEIREQFIKDDVEVSLRFIFENPFIAALAEFIAMKIKEQKLKKNESELVATAKVELEEGTL